MKKYLNLDGKFYEKRNTFHGIEKLEKGLKNKFELFINKKWNHSISEEAKMLGIPLNGEVPYGMPIKDCISITFEEWVNSKGGILSMMWDEFVNNLKVYENIPTKDQFLFVIKRTENWWDFRRNFPSFSYATWEEEITDLVMSIDPIGSTDPKYLGTVDFVLQEYSQLPEQCIVIANTKDNIKLARMFAMTAYRKSWVSTDYGSGQGFSSTETSNWRVYFV